MIAEPGKAEIPGWTRWQRSSDSSSRRPRGRAQSDRAAGAGSRPGNKHQDVLIKTHHLALVR